MEERPSSVSEDRAGAPIGLDDSHARSGEWQEGLFQIAGREKVRGLGVDVTGCGDNYAPPELEFRLANRFEQLSVAIGQDDASVASDQTLIIEVEGNDRQLAIDTVEFNGENEMADIDISGVNALKMRFFLDDEDQDCSYSSAVTAVISNLVVE